MNSKSYCYNISIISISYYDHIVYNQRLCLENDEIEFAVKSLVNWNRILVALWAKAHADQLVMETKSELESSQKMSRLQKLWETIGPKPSPHKTNFRKSGFQSLEINKELHNWNLVTFLLCFKVVRNEANIFDHSSDNILN